MVVTFKILRLLGYVLKLNLFNQKDISEGTENLHIRWLASNSTLPHSNSLHRKMQESIKKIKTLISIHIKLIKLINKLLAVISIACIRNKNVVTLGH